MRTARIAPIALTLAVSVSLTLAGCGDPLFFAAVEDRKICMALPGQSVPAVNPPAGIDIGQQTARWEGDFDLGSDIPGLTSKGTTGGIKMLSFTINSSTDMSSITEVQLDVSDKEGNLDHLASYAQVPGATDPNTIPMTIDQDLDLFDRMVNGGKLRYAIEFTGSPPTVEWSADFTVCMSVEMQIDALEAIQK
ncbi:MAG: hypothetical protein A2V77_05895 [Anaeromyxobacter sp. RBG_16_69_14]|nr:MAG: hypothetical protein A2V77_05895 [Anaeromyxobacter sp. RBG_16_69_14]